MLSKTIAEQALAAALRTGGDFAEIFYEDTRSGSLTLNAGAIETALTGRSAGAGIRVYKGLSSVYVFTNDASLAGLVRAAQKAADAIGSADRAVDVRLTGAIPRNIHAIAQRPMDVPGARRAQVVKAADAAARSVSAEITQVTARLYDWETDVVIANSEGLFIPDRRVYTRLALTAVASGGGESQTGSYNPGAMMGFELFGSRVDPEDVGRRAAKQAVTMLHAEPCPAGVMCAVIDKGFGGVIFHEACGHSLEATAVAFGNSEFAGKLGQQIASPIVTAIDDGTMENEWGSINIDDEGNPATRLVLIENGILKNYMVDRLNGRRMGMAVTGSARRQDYTCAPTSRMRNTYIAAGSDAAVEQFKAHHRPGVAAAGLALAACGSHRRQRQAGVDAAVGDEQAFAVGDDHVRLPVIEPRRHLAHLRGHGAGGGVGGLDHPRAPRPGHVHGQLGDGVDVAGDGPGQAHVHHAVGGTDGVRRLLRRAHKAGKGDVVGEHVDAGKPLVHAHARPGAAPRERRFDGAGVERQAAGARIFIEYLGKVAAGLQGGGERLFSNGSG